MPDAGIVGGNGEVGGALLDQPVDQRVRLADGAEAVVADPLDAATYGDRVAGWIFKSIFITPCCWCDPRNVHRKSRSASTQRPRVRGAVPVSIVRLGSLKASIICNDRA